MPKQEPPELYYLTKVLGIEGFVRKHKEQGSETEEGMTLEVRSRGPESAKLVFVSAASGEFPFVGENEALIANIAKAMKFDFSEILILEFSLSFDLPEMPAEVAQLLSSIQSAAVVSFGDITSRWFAGVSSEPVYGKLLQWHGIEVMPTLSAAEMVAYPETKKNVWRHLQTVMKELP